MELIIYLFIAFVIVNLAVGLYYSRGVKTFREYAIGDGKMHPWLLAATIAATWATGSGFSAYLEESFEYGIYNMMVAIFLSLALVFVSCFVLRMGEFLGTNSIAGAMERLYGRPVALLTAVAAFFCCVGKLACQLRIFSNIVASVLELDPTTLLLTLSTLVILYSVLGGIRAIVFTDLLQFAIIGVCLPLVVYLLYGYVGGVKTISCVPEGKSFEFGVFLKDSLYGVFNGFGKYSYFLLMGFIPPLFQRCLVNKDLLQTRKAFRWATLCYVYIVILVFLLGRMLAVNPMGLNKSELLKSTLKKYSYVGFKALIAFVIMAMALSSADSYINTSAVLLADIFKKKSLSLVRIFGLLTGMLSVGMVLLTKNKGLVTLARVSFLFYAPVVPVLLLALLGFRSSQRTALIAMVCSMLVTLGVKIATLCSLPDAISAGVMANVVLMFGLHYLLGEPGGWVGIKDKAPLIAHAQLSRRRWAGRRGAIRNFNLDRYLRSNLPKKEGHYILFGLYVLTFVFGSIFFLPRAVMQSEGFVWLLGSFLLVNSVTMTYPIWPEGAKRPRFIAPIWSFGVGYILLYIGGLFLLLGGFHIVHVALLIINLTLGLLLLRRKLMGFWVVLGGLMAFLTCRAMGYEVYLAKIEPTWMQIFFALTVTLAGLWAIYANKQKNRQLERRHLSLGSLHRSTEEALAALRLAPDRFAQQLVETNHAGVESAYQMSKDVLGEQHELTTKIDMSAQYLAKTLQLIQNQTQLQERPYVLWKFLNKLYRRHPDLDEAGLILYNHAKTKTIKWDTDKMHQLLYKTYHYLKPHYPDVQYGYLHVQDTTLKYPGRQEPLPAVAFTFTFSAGKKPNIASTYTHTERAEDPYLMGNRQLREIQALVDKHYGYLDLTNVPGEALIVLPVRLDKVRPKVIEDQPAPDTALQNDLLREAKLIEANFWNEIASKDHYNISEIEQAVHLMKAAHQHQARKDNTPYYTHPLTVAKYVSAYDSRPHMLVAALLHDIVEDTHVTLEEVGIRFGHEVARIVKFLSNTNLDTFKKYKVTDKSIQVEQLAQNRDAILIKFCDRIHNLETLSAMPRSKQQAKAKETLEYYVPVVRAAGFADLANRMEEMAKKFL